MTKYWMLASYHELSPQERQMALWLGGIILLGVLGLIIWLTWMNARYEVKKQKVRQFLKEFEKKDRFWNEKEMLLIGKQIFTNVQKAWLQNDFKEIGNHLTERAKNEWTDTWLQMKNMDYVFHCRIVRIERVTIIAAEDHADDSKDNFTVEISAELIRYLKIDGTNQLAPHNTAFKTHITDIYTFIRKDNQWLLDKINYTADLTEIFKYRSTNS
jgi:predicted lipid-binding transport protein (Tim44 family)